jgi:hypothetical protein
MPGEKQPCAHEGCPAELPADENKIPPGWTVVRSEIYGKLNVTTSYYYMCPVHTFVTIEKQKSLFVQE